MTTTDTLQTDEKKWCAYCGVWGDHQSGYCVPFLRDREATLTHQLANARLEVVRLKADLCRAIEIAEEMAGDNWPTEHPLYAELEQLKATLKQDKK